MGNSVTLADIFTAGILASAFQTFLDGGFQKGVKNLITWFEKICKMEAFQAGFGNVKMTQQAVKPDCLIERPGQKKVEPA